MRRVIISQARVDPGLWTRFAQGSEGHLSVAVINRSEKRRREIRNGARAPTEAMRNRCRRLTLAGPSLGSMIAAWAPSANPLVEV